MCEFSVLCNSFVRLELFEDKKLRKTVYRERKRVGNLMGVIEMAEEVILANLESSSMGISLALAEGELSSGGC